MLSSVGCVCWDILALPAFGHQSIPHRHQPALAAASGLSFGAPLSEPWESISASVSSQNVGSLTLLCCNVTYGT